MGRQVVLVLLATMMVSYCHSIRAEERDGRSQSEAAFTKWVDTGFVVGQTDGNPIPQAIRKLCKENPKAVEEMVVRKLTEIKIPVYQRMPWANNMCDEWKQMERIASVLRSLGGDAIATDVFRGLAHVSSGFVSPNSTKPIANLVQAHSFPKIDVLLEIGRKDPSTLKDLAEGKTLDEWDWFLVLRAMATLKMEGTERAVGLFTEKAKKIELTARAKLLLSLIKEGPSKESGEKSTPTGMLTQFLKAVGRMKEAPQKADLEFWAAPGLLSEDEVKRILQKMRDSPKFTSRLETNARKALALLDAGTATSTSGWNLFGDVVFSVYEQGKEEGQPIVVLENDLFGAWRFSWEVP